MSAYENHPVFLNADVTPVLSSEDIADLRVLLTIERQRQTAKKFAVVDDVGTVRSSVDCAKRVLAARRLRAEIFKGTIFGDPAYDILLDLFIRSQRAQPSSIGDSVDASGVPEATALRYIKTLVEKGYIGRLPHPHDKRKSSLIMMPTAFSMMNQWLAHFSASLNG